MNFSLKSSVILIAALGAVASSQATPIYTWALNNPTNPGSSHTYLDTTSTFSLNIAGFKTHNAAPVYALDGTWSTGTVSSTDMYGKTSSPDETGLGIKGLAEDEIDDKSFVQIDTQTLKNHGLGDLTIFISSEQKGEGYVIWGSNSASAPGKALYTGVGTSTQSIFSQLISDSDYGTYRYFSVSASSSLSDGKLVTNGNCLIKDGLSAQVVPEPASMLALATGAIAFFRKRKSA
jgi:hypothetical protein